MVLDSYSLGGLVKSPSTGRKKKRFLMRRKRTLDPNIVIDYRHADVLKRFVTDRGKIIPRRISGASAEQQRAITLAVKRARFLSLIPYSTAHRSERGFSGEIQYVSQSFSTSGMRPPRRFDEQGRQGGFDRNNDQGRPGQGSDRKENYEE
jgi:small subunit ribosomal protein S18